MEEKKTKMEKLTFVRKRHGYTQEELSVACGWAKETISRYERGIRSPNVGKLKKIAEVLGVSVGDLI